MFSHFLRKLGALGRRPAGDAVAAGGLVWRMTPAGRELFGPAGPDPAGWEAAGLAEVVKRNLQRTVTRVRLAGGTVYVKRCRVGTPRAWAREILRPPKARLEFENAARLAALGVPAVEPLACGTAPGPLPGESVLVTRAEPGAEPFADFLARPLPPADRRRVARGFARFLARMHASGVAHPDPHPGNFLVRPGPRFALADLHAVRFGRPMSLTTTLNDLVVLNRWFQVRATRADRLRFWRAYLRERPPMWGGRPPDDPAAMLAKYLEDATEASNARFWAARTARYLGNNRDSHRVRGPAASGYAIRELPADVLRGWLADPDGAFAGPGVRVLKDSRTSTVAEVPVPFPDGPRSVILKRFNLKGRFAAVKNLFRPSPALRSWLVGNGVRDRGLPTARPLAVFHTYRWGVPMTGYAAFEQVADAPELSRAVAAARPAAVRVWADRLGRLIRLMHARQVCHRDLKAPNVLLAGGLTDPEAAVPVLIDLVGVEAGRPVRVAARVRDLARLNASFLGSPAVTRADRVRFLRAYLGWGLHGRGDWKGWWRRVARATAAKAAKNARAGRPLG